LAELDQPLFSDAAKDVIKNAKGQDTFLYRFADRAHRQVYGKPFGPWRQGIGDCVSFGWAMGSYVGQCVDWAEGELPEPPKLVATEPLYSGSRTSGRLPPVSQAGFSDGSYGGAAARWVAGKCKDQTVGGILFRQQYPGADLTTYSPQRAKEWGNVLCGGGQVGNSLAKLANKNTATNVALVRNFDEAAASIESGYCVPVCSGVGFSSQRDADGFAQVGIVFDQENLKWRNRGHGVRLSLEVGHAGQRDGKQCAALGFVLNIDLAAMTANGVLGNGQTKPGTRDPIGCKGLEQSGQHIGGNAGAVVFDGHDSPQVIRLGLNMDGLPVS
jgi:hypothetical protein